MKRMLLAAVVLILAAIGFYWWQHDVRRPVKQVTINGHKTATANSNVPGGTNPNPTTGANTPQSAPSAHPTSQPSASVQPTPPTGQFISDHHPNLSGNPAPNTETSTCNTTPGARCQIRFTKDGVTKQLPAQITDGSGDTIWSNWTLQSIGLTAGTWDVSAVAINGNKTATAQDALQLVVAP